MLSFWEILCQKTINASPNSLKALNHTKKLYLTKLMRKKYFLKKYYKAWQVTKLGWKKCFNEVFTSFKLFARILWSKNFIAPGVNRENASRSILAISTISENENCNSKTKCHRIDRKILKVQNQVWKFWELKWILIFMENYDGFVANMHDHVYPMKTLKPKTGRNQ